MPKTWIFNLLFVLANFYAPAESTGVVNRDNDMIIAEQDKDGDMFVIKLGGLFSIFKRDDNENCDMEVVFGSSVQWLEMTLYTIEKINANSSFLPGVRLVLDPVADCVTDTRALEHIVRQYLRQSFTSQNTSRNDTYWGVIGPETSEVSVATAKLLGLFEMSQVSISATSPILSDKQRFPYYFRTASSDEYQIKAMIKLLEQNRWHYVSFVYEANDYGLEAFNAFRSQIENTVICLAVEIRIPRDPTQESFREITDELLADNNANVIITFITSYPMALLMREIYYSNHVNATKRFQWIWSDANNRKEAKYYASLINELSLRDAFHEIMDGAVGFGGQVFENPEFDLYFHNKTLENLDEANPYFDDYISYLYSCSLENDSPQRCDRNLTIPKNQSIDHMIQHAENAVLAFAHAFHNAQTDLCRNSEDVVCDEFTKLTSKQIREYLRSVSFYGFSGGKFGFDDSQDGPVLYDVSQYDGHATQQWQTLGHYHQVTQETKDVDLGRVTGRGYVISLCGKECESNEYTLLDTDKSCCWHCVPCDERSIVKSNHTSVHNHTYCQACKDHQKPNVYTQQCEDLPITYLSFEDTWAWIVAVFSVVGLLLTFSTIFIYIYAWNTPVIRASGRELCSIILIGLVLAFAMSFFFCFKPTPAICVIKRLGTGLLFTLVYAGILVKTVRISLIFNTLSKKLVRDYKRMLQPLPQVVIALGLTVIEIFLLTVWFVMQPPEVLTRLSSKGDMLFLSCAALNSSVFLISLSYPILLVIICSIYAIRIRKVPVGFNEAKHIGFAVYTTLVIWIAQIPTYLTNTAVNLVLRDAIYCLGLSLNGLVILLAIFGPKVYIVIFRPQKNNQDAMLEHKTSRIISQTSMGCSNHSSDISAGRHRNGSRDVKLDQNTSQSNNLDGNIRNKGGVNISANVSEHTSVVAASRALSQDPLGHVDSKLANIERRHHSVGDIVETTATYYKRPMSDSDIGTLPLQFLNTKRKNMLPAVRTEVPDNNVKISSKNRNNNSANYLVSAVDNHSEKVGPSMHLESSVLKDLKNAVNSKSSCLETCNGYINGAFSQDHSYL
ncbi:metabotropic glutamate receptor 3-like [Clavelina lepadiformis]|uniref:metabotropic glutamate receptor 3-like n=1 Tax=Clavelina lepadiformis TaxID=159417 RepID=UPI0040428FB4